MNGLLNGWTNRNDTGRVKQLPPPNGTTEPTTEAATQSASHLSWNAKWPEARDATYIANPVPSQCESSYHGHRPDIRSTPPLWFKFHRGCCTQQTRRVFSHWAKLAIAVRAAGASAPCPAVILDKASIGPKHGRAE